MASQDNNEAFTNVLDLNATEVYTQQQYIPSSSLPYSSSADHLKFITASIGGTDVNIAQFYHEISMSRSENTFPNSKKEVWFAISGSGFTPNATGVNSTIIEQFQLTNWLSNKYATASFALNDAETPAPNNAYNVRVRVNGTFRNAGQYQFDYKTGVLQFKNNSDAPIATDAVTLTGYRYVGKTLANETFGGGGGAGIFALTGSTMATTNNLEITGSLLVTGSNIDFSGVSSITGSIISASSIIGTTFTGNSATFNSASIDHLVVNTLISASTIVTSGSNTFGDDTTDTQTLIGTVIMTGSAEVTGSLSIKDGVLSIPGFNNVSASLAAALTGSAGGSVSGIFSKVGSTDIFASTSSLSITGSTLQSTPLDHSTNLTASDGSAKYAMVVSQSLWHRNANVGVPTSNAWKANLQGSYFNTFDHNTDISEILRFMAGLLSSSAPSSAPNTKTYNSITATQGGTQTGTAPAGYVPQNAADPTVVYLQNKGFASAGGVLFSGITPIYDYNSSGVYKRNYSSVAGGSTTVSSSADAQLFGLGTIGLDFAVSGTVNWHFSSGSNKITTLTSQSENLLTTSGPGTSNGLTIGNIKTANPAVIPNEFQDGKFANIFEAEISDISGGLYPSGLDFQTTESVGYYQLTSSIKIRTGSASSNFSDFKIDKAEVFYAPVDELNANINSDSAQSITLSLPHSASLSATSRSLSGAPYLRTAKWVITSSVAGVFNPLYAGNTSQVVHMTDSGDGDSIISFDTSGGDKTTLTTNNGSINTSGVVFTAADVVRNTGTPAIDDIVKMSGSIQLVAGTGGATNIVSNNSDPNNLDDLTFSIVTTAKNRTGTPSTLRTDTFSYFDIGSFDQPTASGSMGYYGLAQGNENGSNGTTTENFKGENFRKQINNNLLTVTSADAYGTSYTDGLVAPLIDLQVKPGFLVKPGGTYKYWLPTAGSSDYRFYARTFQSTAAQTYSSIVVNVGNNSLVKWRDSTTSGIAIGIIFESGTSKIQDLANYDNDGDLAVNSGTDDALNPFGGNITIIDNSNTTGTNPSGNNYTMALNILKNKVLTASQRNFIVCVRYKGDQAPITGISISYS